MFKFLAPVLGLVILLASLVTMPTVTAANGVSIPVHPPVEVPASLTMIPFVGDLLLKVQIWLPILFQVIGAFAMIASMTANQTDDKIVNYILKAINFLGFNFGTAKNDPAAGVTRSLNE
ncbi:MAG: hypothetical protein AAF942_07625 [Pseudomonadota bacterium]